MVEEVHCVHVLELGVCVHLVLLSDSFGLQHRNSVSLEHVHDLFRVHVCHLWCYLVEH